MFVSETPITHAYTHDAIPINATTTGKHEKCEDSTVSVEEAAGWLGGRAAPAPAAAAAPAPSTGDVEVEDLLADAD